MTSFEHAMHAVEESNLPTQVVEDALDALSFTQAVHELFSSFSLVNSNEVDVHVLEKTFEAFLGELTAASIFLASVSGDVSKSLLESAKQLEEGKSEQVPQLVVEGYRKLAERVARTKVALQSEV